VEDGTALVLRAAAMPSEVPNLPDQFVLLFEDPVVIEDFAPFGPYQTWYRIVGDLYSGKPPLFVLHGGPGCTHDYVDSFKELAARGRCGVRAPPQAARSRISTPSR
jgi:hypothetical protein